jgi:hypothetical protein
MVTIPETLVVNKFYQFVGGPKHNKHQHTYNGSCPICREGTSWLKKKRCYYIPKKNIVCCHNCGWYSNPFKWVLEVGNYNIRDLIKEIKNFDGTITEIKQETKAVKVTENLPQDSINLFNENECSYWDDNYVLEKCKDIINSRRLNTAVNRPQSLFLSLTDKVHKNRLVIPFYDSKNNIIFYQTRKILDSDSRPKYLSKVGTEKSLYGINNISVNCDTIYVTEGPLDAFFIRNGVAVAGITQSQNLNFTPTQEKQLKEFFLYKKVWVLDNQHLDKTSREKTKKLLEAGQTVFIWPSKDYKDLNDLCIDKKLNEVDISYIQANSYTKLKGLLKLSRY